MGTPNIGDVGIKIREHQHRQYGASDVNKLQFNQPGVTADLLEFNISGTLGSEGETHATRVTGNFSAQDIVSDVYLDTLRISGGNGFRVTGALSANLHFTGAGPHQGVLDVFELLPPREIDMAAGTLAGTIRAGRG